MKQPVRWAYSLLPLSALILILVHSCNKPINASNPINSDTLYNTANSAVQLEIYYDDPFNLFLEAGQQSGLFSRTSSSQSIEGCGVLTEHLTGGISYPVTVTMDFGSGCTGTDGRTRSGIVEAIISAPFDSTGSTITFGLDSFYIGKVHIEGGRIIRNISDSDSLMFSSRVIDGIVTWPNGLILSYYDSLDCSLLPGSDFTNPSSVNFSIMGSGMMGFQNGQQASIQILAPLQKELTCKYFVAGQLLVQDNDQTANLDFGPGVCSGVVTVAIGDESGQIILPQ